MDGPPTRMTYSPDGGEAACEPSANSDTKQTSKRRFIMAGEGIIYAAREIAPGAWRRTRGAPTMVNQLPRAQNLPTFAVCELAQICRHEPALPQAVGGSCNSKPSQSRM